MFTLTPTPAKLVGGGGQNRELPGASVTPRGSGRKNLSRDHTLPKHGVTRRRSIVQAR